MKVIDTSALIRFFTNDDPPKALKVKRLLDGGEEIELIDAVVMELVFTLTKTYTVPKNDVVVMLNFLIGLNNINTSQHLPRAVSIFQKNNLSITDCLIIAASEKPTDIVSFDDKLIKTAKNNLP